MDLLSSSEKDEIYEAFRDVTDTFHKTIVDYNQTVKGFDQFQRGDNNTELDHQLNCRVKLLDDEDSEIEETSSGTSRRQDYEFTFDFQYLTEQSLTTVDSKGNKVVVFDPEVDYITYEDVKHKILLITYDNSDFAGQPILCTVRCRREVKNYVG